MTVAFPLIAGAMIFGLDKADEGIDINFAYSLGTITLWNTILSCRASFSIRNVTVDEQGGTIASEKTIPFKNVQSVDFYHLVNPLGVTIEYHDEVTGEQIRISYMANSKYAEPLKKDKMATYLIEQAKLHNSNFQGSSASKNLFFLLAIGLPFFLAALFFMLHSNSFGLL